MILPTPVLYYTALYCTVLHCTVMYFSVCTYTELYPVHGMVLYHTIMYYFCMNLYCVLPYPVHDMVWYCFILCSTMPYCNALFCPYYFSGIWHCILDLFPQCLIVIQLQTFPLFTVYKLHTILFPNTVRDQY